MNLTSTTRQRPTATRSGRKVAEASGSASPLVHHRTVGGVDQVKSVSGQKAHGGLRGLRGVDLERYVHLPAHAAVGLQQFQFEARTHQNAALDRGHRCNPALSLPRPRYVPRHQASPPCSAPQATSWALAA